VTIKMKEMEKLGVSLREDEAAFKKKEGGN
jgi:hypothetical protein